MNDNYGVLTEQGYPVGDNLGFKPLSEEEKEELENKFNTEND